MAQPPWTRAALDGSATGSRSRRSSLRGAAFEFSFKPFVLYQETAIRDSYFVQSALVVDRALYSIWDGMFHTGA